MPAAGKWFRVIVCHDQHSRPERDNWLPEESHHIRINGGDRNIDHEYLHRSNKVTRGISHTMNRSFMLKEAVP